MSFVKVNNFLSSENADNMLKFLATLPYNSSGERGVVRYGKTLSYSSNKISEHIPEPIETILISRLQAKGFVEEVGHVTVNRYLPNDTIPFHTDNHEAGEIITIVSLGGSCNMLFKNNKHTLTYEVPNNSLIQFMDELRWKYKHSVSDIKETRYSIVFRKH